MRQQRPLLWAPIRRAREASTLEDVFTTNAEAAEQYLHAVGLSVDQVVHLRGSANERLAALRAMACDQGVEPVAESTFPLAVAWYLREHPEALVEPEQLTEAEKDALSLAPDAFEARRGYEASRWEVIHEACRHARRAEFPDRYAAAKAQVAFINGVPSRVELGGLALRRVVMRAAELSGGGLVRP